MMSTKINKKSPPQTQSNNQPAQLLAIIFFFISLIEAGVIYNLLNNPKKEPDSETAFNITGPIIDTSESNFILSTPSAPTNTPGPKSTKGSINKEYSFPLKGDEGETLSEIKFNITNYELTNEVVVNNRKALMIDGRIVLIINVEITNEFDQPVEIIARDYLRLSINNQDKWLAADIHSDPVEVRPQSTKETRIGFTINESDANLRLQVGEVDGEKEVINIDN